MAGFSFVPGKSRANDRCRVAPEARHPARDTGRAALYRLPAMSWDSRRTEPRSCLSVNIEWRPRHVALQPLRMERSTERQRRQRSDDLTTYIYRDAEGVVRFRKVRNLPGREPRFWLEQPDGTGGWKKGHEGRRHQHHLSRRRGEEAIRRGPRDRRVVEGEKDANNLWRLGIAGNLQRAWRQRPGKKPKWTAKHSEQLAGADIVVFNDNDAAGYAHADADLQASLGIAKRVRRLDLKTDWPEIPKGGDVSDWLAVGGEHTPEKLKALIEAAPDLRRPTRRQPTTNPTKPPTTTPSSSGSRSWRRLTMSARARTPRETARRSRRRCSIARCGQAQRTRPRRRRRQARPRHRTAGADAVGDAGRWHRAARRRGCRDPPLCRHAGSRATRSRCGSRTRICSIGS